MSKTRKILSIVLAVVMAFGVFSICSFADPATDTATWTVEVSKPDGTALGATVAPNDEVLVTVKLQSNFYVGTIGLPVYFSDAFTYVSGSAAQEQIYGANALYENGINEAYSTGVSGVSGVYAVFVPKSSAGATSPIFTTATKVFSFKIKAVTETTASVYLPADQQKTESNKGGKFYVGARDSSDVTTDEDLYVTFDTTAATQSITISAAVVVPDPVFSGVGTGYVDTDRGYVYGVPAGTTAANIHDNYFTCTNGSFTVSGNGTGATVTVYREDGTTVFATYKLIIFGDVNGSGTVTLDDYIAVKLATLGSSLGSAENTFAADVNGSSSVTLDDYIAVKLATLGSTLDPDPYH